MNFLVADLLGFFRRSKVADGGGSGNFFVAEERGDSAATGLPVADLGVDGGVEFSNAPDFFAGC